MINLKQIFHGKNKKDIMKSDGISSEDMEGLGAIPSPYPAVDEREGQHKILDILIVDDEPIVGKRLKPALMKYGYDVEVFEDSTKAIDRIKEKTFDVVVTDLQMEDMNGFQMIEHVNAKSAKTKIIFMTGFATVENVHEALAKGASDFIAKPFKPKDLQTVIVKAMMSLGSRKEDQWHA